MNILFFIGNGFDLKVGLKTSFKHVLKAYLQELTSDEKIIKFKETIKRDFENWSDFESYMGEYTEEIGTENFKDYFYYMDDFFKFMRKYLENEESKARYEKTKEISETFQKSILHFYEYLDNQPKKIIKDMMKDIVKFNHMSLSQNPKIK